MTSNIEYSALSTPNMNRDANMIAPSVSIRDVPTGRCVRYEIIWPMISVPPVLEPALNTSPIPTPVNRPPYSAESQYDISFE